MKTVNFITIGDNNFFHTIKFSVRQINKLYPDSKIFIYDWGFTDSQKKFLKDNNNVEIIGWKLLFFDVNINFTSLVQKIRVVYGIRGFKNLLAYIKNIPRRFLTSHYSRYLLKENFYINKFFCIENAINNLEGNFIYLDADAFLINRVDELFKDDFDFGFTLRRKKELNFKLGECQVINAGVLFFLGGKQKNKLFIQEWKRKIQETNEYLIEQTALVRLLQEKSDTIFDEYFNKENLKFLEESVSIKILPCEMYNYNWIEEFNSGKNKEKIKILHFKGGRHTEDNFKKLINKLDL